MSKKPEHSSQEKEMKAGPSNSNTRLLQIGVVFLALVSFFTTANGMKEYIFTGPKNSIIAYAASAAIQGILLALSMNLPGYLHDIRAQKRPKLIKIVLYILALLLTGVAIFCSSWFSYTYIASVLHVGSWDTDSELLVQQTYRSELNDARDYAHAYQIYLEDSVGEKILLLEEQSRQFYNSNTSITSGDIWDREAADYVTGRDTIASSYMATVIDAMRNATKEKPSQGELDLAVQAISEAKVNIASSMETVQQSLDRLAEDTARYAAQIQTLNARINNATENTDIDALNRAINNFTQLIDNTAQEQSRLYTEYTELYNASNRIPYYENLLGLNSSTSFISIRSRLLELQQEFFAQEPDEDKLLGLAEDIFESLLSAVHTISSETNPDNPEVPGSTDNPNEELSATALLLQMNQLIQNLKDYSQVKGIESSLEELSRQLSTTAGGNAASQPAVSPTPSDALLEPSDESPEPSDETTEPSDVSPEPSDETTEPSDETTEPSDEAQGGTSDKEAPWKTLWSGRLEQLKAQISALPMYGGTETADETALTESQLNLLHRYDRNKSSANLDNMLRLYITKHNAIHQGLIYLQSPYAGLAIFALILALFFDLTGFVFGVVIQGSQQPKNGASGGHGAFGSPSAESGQVDWSIVKTLNRYVVLTGDYENRDNVFYYKVFLDGLLTQWAVEARTAYKRGIYIQDPVTETQGDPASETAQELLFAHQSGGPSDGIYHNGQLLFEEGSLLWKQNPLQNPEQEPKPEPPPRFLASIDEYVPVHSYNPNKGENQTIPAKQLVSAAISVETAVVALNAKGTMVSAIYIVEQ